jgi:hypothetical protein
MSIMATSGNSSDERHEIIANNQNKKSSLPKILTPGKQKEVKTKGKTKSLKDDPFRDMENLLSKALSLYKSHFVVLEKVQKAKKEATEYIDFY